MLSLAEVKEKIGRVLGPTYPDPAVARIAGNEVYFARGAYEKLQQDPLAMRAMTDAVLAIPGIAGIFRAEELAGGVKNLSPTRTAVQLSYFPGRSGDLYLLQQPYWLTESTPEGSKRYTGTGHGTPYSYDQRVPILLMGFGIKPGQYFDEVTPADIAPTLAALTGVTLATREGQILRAALK
ncbi:MAG: hypothetical protein JO121_17920 [Deltaproteobacteria bacterium]|nr:hypothetical protein [Deltaproteobacteria bacterium]